MKERTYTVVLQPAPPEEGGGFTVTVPALPGCVSEGDSWEEAIAMAKEAIGLYIEDLEAHGEPVPEDAGTSVTVVKVAA